MSANLPWEVIETMDKCALRFDAYKWMAEVRGDSEIDFSQWVTPVVHTLTLHTDELANFCVFFGLQRYLGKWGGEQLPQSDPCHTAYRYLFLHLYKIPVPRAYRFSEAPFGKWDDLSPERIELYAAMVRRALLSPAKRKEFESGKHQD